MDDKLFNELEANLKEAVDVAKGKITPETAYFVITPAAIKAIRRNVKMSQAVFARSYHLSLDTMKGMEQGSVPRWVLSITCVCPAILIVPQNIAVKASSWVKSAIRNYARGYLIRIKEKTSPETTCGLSVSKSQQFVRLKMMNFYCSF